MILPTSGKSKPCSSAQFSDTEFCTSLRTCRLPATKNLVDFCTDLWEKCNSVQNFNYSYDLIITYTTILYILNNIYYKRLLSTEFLTTICCTRLVRLFYAVSPLYDCCQTWS